MLSPMRIPATVVQVNSYPGVKQLRCSIGAAETKWVFRYFATTLLFLATDAKPRTLAMLTLRSPGAQEIWAAATFRIWERRGGSPNRHGESEPPRDESVRLADRTGKVNRHYPSVMFYQAVRSGVSPARILPH